MRVLAFTVDLDRDCNVAVPGEMAAASRDRGRGVPPRHSASAEGMEAIADMLRSLSLPATVFAEGETLLSLPDASVLRGHELACHGMGHEDLTGESSGLVPDDGELRAIIRRSKEALSSRCGIVPRGFRAPYLNIDPRVLSHLGEEGFSYDSSMTAAAEEGSVTPWRLDNGMLEIPLARDRDAEGRIMDSYLWAMHEGRRPVEDYFGMLERFRAGALVMATHSWHVAEGVRDGRRGKAEAAAQTEALAQVLGRAKDLGFEVLTLEELERRFSADR